MNFSWVIDGKIAGHRGLTSEDELRHLKSCGVAALVRLIEDHEAEVTPEEIKRVGLDDLHLQVTDYCAPTIEQIEQALEFIEGFIAEGRGVGVSCWQGYGRTGTILACYLVSKGWGSETAIQEVRSKRPGSIMVGGQEGVIRQFAAHHENKTSG